MKWQRAGQRRRHSISQSNHDQAAALFFGMNQAAGEMAPPPRSARPRDGSGWCMHDHQSVNQSDDNFSENAVRSIC